MRSIVAKNASSKEALMKMKIDYPKSYSLTELKSDDVDIEDSQA